MTTQEEQLWDYIDGFGTAAERAAIELRLKKEEPFRQLYDQLLALNTQIGEHLELDEPSMSFSRKVMEQVAQETAPVVLKTKVDQRVIYVIGGFFFTTLLGFLVYAFATSVPDFSLQMPTLNWALDIDGLINSVVLKVFLFINTILLLVYLDSYLRKGLKKAQKKGEQ